MNWSVLIDVLLIPMTTDVGALLLVNVAVPLGCEGFQLAPTFQLLLTPPVQVASWACAAREASTASDRAAAASVGMNEVVERSALYHPLRIIALSPLPVSSPSASLHEKFD